ncbi:hypothetical protein ACH4Q7_22760 [Streptomyces roseolus]|uniref:hypothetical protein n=1 Tax=Streptomyces roseolus TaxID=67358 RepID=UPI0037BAEDCC
MSDVIVQEAIRDYLTGNPRMEYAAMQDAQFRASLTGLREALELVDDALAVEEAPEEMRRRVAARAVAAGLERARVQHSRELLERLGIATIHP